MEDKITLDTKITDVIRINPEAVKILMNYGLHCIGCHMAVWETLDEAVSSHGLSDKEKQNLLKELNA